jgi:hypothetical protein
MDVLALLGYNILMAHYNLWQLDANYSVMPIYEDSTYIHINQNTCKQLALETLSI